MLWYVCFDDTPVGSATVSYVQSDFFTFFFFTIGEGVGLAANVANIVKLMDGTARVCAIGIVTSSSVQWVWR
jgi:hypothetical protein